MAHYTGTAGKENLLSKRVRNNEVPGRHGPQNLQKKNTLQIADISQALGLELLRFKVKGSGFTAELKANI